MVGDAASTLELTQKRLYHLKPNKPKRVRNTTLVHSEGITPQPDDLEPSLPSSTAYALLHLVALRGGFGEGRFPITRSDGATLEEEWRGSFTGQGGDSQIAALCFVSVVSWCAFFSERSLRGSLTRRCGRGESAVRGRAVGFRVGHREGHWAGHWGRWRQQEGAWHFALAAPVWLQTTQTGSRRATCDNPQTGMNGTQRLKAGSPKKYPRRRRRGEQWREEVGGVGGEQQPKG